MTLGPVPCILSRTWNGQDAEPPWLTNPMIRGQTVGFLGWWWSTVSSIAVASIICQLKSSWPCDYCAWNDHEMPWPLSYVNGTVRFTGDLPLVECYMAPGRACSSGTLCGAPTSLASPSAPSSPPWRFSSSSAAARASRKCWTPWGIRKQKNKEK